MTNSDRELTNAKAILDRRRADRSDAETLLDRVTPEGRARAARARARQQEVLLKTGRRLGVAFLAVVAVTVIWAVVIGPIGVLGFAGALGALIAAWLIIMIASYVPEETPERLVEADIAQLPARTESWLQLQRPALPAPAARLVDTIGLRLEALQPQLAGIDPREPAAQEVRKLVAEELPELIQGYTRVPPSLRRQERDGVIPDRQLVDGLAVVESELARMSADLASGDLHRFAVQKRYLELKYKDGSED